MDYRDKFTPDDKADILVSKLEIEHGDVILEPSCGDGQLIRAIARTGKQVSVVGVDIFDYLIDCKYSTCLISKYTMPFETFLLNPYDKIVANPPFDEDKWIGHMVKMYTCLKDKGTMVCIIPARTIVTNVETDYIIASYFSPFYDKVTVEPLDNWVTNSDGSVTKLKILTVVKNAF